MIKIDNNVPLPGKGPTVETNIVKMALETMAPGQSFLIKDLGIKQPVNRTRRAAEDLGIEILIAKDEDGDRRCWRKGDTENTALFEDILKPQIKKEFRAVGITRCVNCGKGPEDILGFAHKYKRGEIDPGDIAELKNVIRICSFPCHDSIENGTDKRKFKPDGGWEPWTHQDMAREFDRIKKIQDQIFVEAGVDDPTK